MNALITIAAVLAGISVFSLMMGLRTIFAPEDEATSPAGRHKKPKLKFDFKRVTVQRDVRLMLTGVLLGTCASAAVSLLIASADK